MELYPRNHENTCSEIDVLTLFSRLSIAGTTDGEHLHLLQCPFAWNLSTHQNMDRDPYLVEHSSMIACMMAQGAN